MESLVRQNLVSTFEFYKGKRVLVTGHNGFKGSWLSKILTMAGASVVGLSLKNKENEILFSSAKLDEEVEQLLGDIRDKRHVEGVINKYNFDVVFHLAAQPLVRESYEDPAYTYETNVIGTLNLLEAIRKNPKNVKSIVNVTTDKVYLNREWEWGYRENEALNGYDPYSNSKSCSDILTQSYFKCFFKPQGISVSVARAGNVIGGGDRSKDRIIPDCVRNSANNQIIHVRNPYSTRPYQHVLEPLYAYMLLAYKQTIEPVAGEYNVGPEERDCVTTGELVSIFCEEWPGAKWEHVGDKNAPHEANFLKLDSSHIKNKLAWTPRWHINDAIKKTVEWERAFCNNPATVSSVMEKQINEFFELNSLS